MWVFHLRSFVSVRPKKLTSDTTKVKEGANQTLLNHIRTLEDRIGKLQARVETLEVAATLNYKGTPDNKDKMNINILHQVETNNPPIQPIVNFSRNVVKVKCGDLFESPSNKTIVHCVAKDFKMSDGIACIIKHKYCIDPVPLATFVSRGHCLIKNTKQNFIYTSNDTPGMLLLKTD